MVPYLALWNKYISNAICWLHLSATCHKQEQDFVSNICADPFQPLDVSITQYIPFYDLDLKEEPIGGALGHSTIITIQNISRSESNETEARKLSRKVR